MEFRHDWEETYSHIIEIGPERSFLISMPGWYWNTLDWIEGVGGISAIDVVAEAWGYVCDPDCDPDLFPDNEMKRFRALFSTLIWEMFLELDAVDGNGANDNLPALRKTN